MHSTEDCKLPNKRRPSVLRLFTGLSRLRRSNTGETSGSGGDTSDPWSPAVFPDHNEEEVLWSHTFRNMRASKILRKAYTIKEVLADL